MTVPTSLANCTCLGEQRWLLRAHRYPAARDEYVQFVMVNVYMDSVRNIAWRTYLRYSPQASLCIAVTYG